MSHYQMKKMVGPHRHVDGTWIKPGDVLDCEEHEIRGALDKFEMISEAKPASSPEEDGEKKTDKAGLVLLHRGGGRYNVVNPETEEKINDDYLTKEEAQSLLRERGESTIPVEAL